MEFNRESQKWIAKLLLIIAFAAVVTAYSGTNILMSIGGGMVIGLFVNWLWDKYDPVEKAKNESIEKGKR